MSAFLAAPPSASPVAAEVAARIGGLAALPTTAAVAAKLIRLARNPDAGPADYARVIGGDPGLSGQLLALANSAWTGVTAPITTVTGAVKHLGPASVRTLAISACLRGLYSEIQLTPAESREFWQIALRKALFARELARLRDPAMAEDAFLAGLLQDVGLPLLYVCARATMSALLNDRQLDSRRLPEEERTRLGTDHTAVGAQVARHLHLPQQLVDAAALHHDADRLRRVALAPAWVEAVAAAARVPHGLESWHLSDVAELQGCLEACAGPSGADIRAVAAGVEERYHEFMAYFFDGSSRGEPILTELIREATLTLAGGTTDLVQQLHALRHQMADRDQTLTALQEQQDELQRAAEHDALTGALNRGGFCRRARESTVDAARRPTSYALIYFDLDDFKSVNDTWGHEFGDAALKSVASAAGGVFRQSDVFGRLGGDEFAALVGNCSLADARRLVDRMRATFAEQVGAQERLAGVTLSVGMVWVPPAEQARDLDLLLSAADTLMYQAKKRGGDRVESRTL